MWSSIIKAIIGALKGLFGIKDPSPEPSVADLSARATANADRVNQEEAANVIVNKASDARTAAVAGIVRDTTEASTAVPGTSPSVNDTLKRDFPEDFRD